MLEGRKEKLRGGEREGERLDVGGKAIERERLIKLQASFSMS